MQYINKMFPQINFTIIYFYVNRPTAVLSLVHTKFGPFAQIVMGYTRFTLETFCDASN